MEEVKLISYKGKSILRVYFPDDTDFDKLKQIISEAESYIGKQPLNSVYAITGFGNFHYNTEMTRCFEDYVKFNKPYMKASAVLGISGLKKVLYNAYTLLSHRQVKICETEEEAKEFVTRELDE
jgi:hypothetical protein